MEKIWHLKNIALIKNILMYFVILLIAIGILYGIDGKNFYVYVDSQYYLNLSTNAAVMPIYPLIIFLFRKMVGESSIFSIIILFQCVWAFTCILITTIYISKKFELKRFETIAINVLLYLPLLSSLPECVVSHQILTEALTYPLMYIFVILAYQATINWNPRNALGLICTAMILHLTKTMMIWVYIPVVTVAFRGIGNTVKKRHFRLLYCIISCVVAIVLLLGVLKLQGIYISSVPRLLATDGIGSDSNATIDENVENKISVSPNIVTSQFETLIEIKGWTVLRSDTIERLSGEDREIAALVYNELQGKGILLEETTIGWNDGWEGLSQDRTATIVNEVIRKFYISRGIDDIQYTNNLVRIESLKLSILAIFYNIGGFMYLCARLIFPGFMASVFFQNMQYYVLCMIVTIVLLILGAILLWHNRRYGCKEYRFARLVMFLIVIQVVIISLVHIPLQRYLVYFQGMYYIALYMLLKRMKIKFVEKYDRNGITENS